MAISDKLEELNEIKGDIKDAINAKGGSAGDDMSEYANAILSLSPSSASLIVIETTGTTLDDESESYVPNLTAAQVSQIVSAMADGSGVILKLGDQSALVNQKGSDSAKEWVWLTWQDKLELQYEKSGNSVSITYTDLKANLASPMLYQHYLHWVDYPSLNVWVISTNPDSYTKETLQADVQYNGNVLSAFFSSSATPASTTSWAYRILDWAIASNKLWYINGAVAIEKTNVYFSTGMSDNVSAIAPTTPSTAYTAGEGITIVDNEISADFNSVQAKLTAQTAYTAKGTSTKVPQITTNALGQVTSITEVDISGGGSGGVSDVQVNGTSVVSSGVANIGISSSSALGVVKGSSDNGKVSVGADGAMSVNGWSGKADASALNDYVAKSSASTSQVFAKNPTGVFGLSYGSQNNVNTLMLRDGNGKAQIGTPTSSDGALTIANKAYVDGKVAERVSDVQVNGTTVVSDGIANISAVSSFGGATGAITLGSNFSMTGNQLNGSFATEGYVDGKVGNYKITSMTETADEIYLTVEAL